jgi:alpha-N-acetylglucosamine transferase
MFAYDLILFIDAVALITRPIDAIFEELNIYLLYSTQLDWKNTIKSDETCLLPAEYVFAACSDNALTGESDHPSLPLLTSVFSAGFWVAAPSLKIFEYLLPIINHYRRFDPHTME